MIIIQNVFYILGIIFMSLSIGILLIIAISIIVIKRKVDSIEKSIEDKINAITNNPADAALDFGSKVASKAAKKIYDMVENKKEKK